VDLDLGLKFRVPDRFPHAEHLAPRLWRTREEDLQERLDIQLPSRMRRRPGAPCGRYRIRDLVHDLVLPLLAVITISQVAQATGDAAGPYVTDTYTREPGRYYPAICHNYAFAGSAGTLGATGFSEPAESTAGGRLYNGNLNRLHVLESVVGSTTTGTSSFSVTGNGGVGGTVAILEVQGGNTSDWVRQIVFNSGTGNDPNALGLTYAAFGDATNNAIISAWAAGGDSTFTTPTNHTETYDPGTANAAVGVFYDVGSISTTPSSTNSVAFLDVAAVGIEINVATAGDTNARLIGGDLLHSIVFGRLVN
jgi:hypothetical protein